VDSGPPGSRGQTHTTEFRHVGHQRVATAGSGHVPHAPPGTISRARGCAGNSLGAHVKQLRRAGPRSEPRSGTRLRRCSSAFHRRRRIWGGPFDVEGLRTPPPRGAHSASLRWSCRGSACVLHAMPGVNMFFAAARGNPVVADAPDAIAVAPPKWLNGVCRSRGSDVDEPTHGKQVVEGPAASNTLRGWPGSLREPGVRSSSYSRAYLDTGRIADNAEKLSPNGASKVSLDLSHRYGARSRWLCDS